MRLVASAEALADAELAIDWSVEQAAWPTAEGFHQELTAAFARLLASPALGTPAPDGTRVLPMHRFPYSLVDRVSTATKFAWSPSLASAGAPDAGPGAAERAGISRACAAASAAPAGGRRRPGARTWRRGERLPRPACAAR